MAAQTAMELDLAPGSARLMLLDTYGLVYRAFFALPELTTTRGMRIEAAYGFTMMLNKLIADEKPTHVIAAFDKGLPAARVALYPQYKAQRNEPPDELREQFTLVRRILATFAIPVVEIDGEEADDIIATLARRAEELRQESLVVTGDLDLLQIVDPRTTVLTTRRGITELGRYDEAKVRERYELEPPATPHAVASEEQLQGEYASHTSITDPPDYAKLAALIEDAAGRERVAVAKRGEVYTVSPDDEVAFAFNASATSSAPNVGEAFAALWQRVPQLVVHDAKSVANAGGLPIRAFADDPMVGAHLFNPSRAFVDIGQAASELLDRVLPEDRPAAAADAARRLALKAREELERRDQIALYTDVELPLVSVLAKMERAGVALDLGALRELSAQVDEAVERLQPQVYGIAG